MWFDKILVNGETIQHREKVVYSALLGIYNRKKSYFAGVKKGFNDWMHLHPMISDDTSSHSMWKE